MPWQVRHLTVIGEDEMVWQKDQQRYKQGYVLGFSDEQIALVKQYALGKRGATE
jgi:hypothetical protein